MSWEWLILIAIVRLLFVIAPFLKMIDHFAFSKEYAEEAQDFARACACKAMLLSFPALQLINLLAMADKNCGQLGVASFPLAAGFLLSVLIAVLLFFIPAHYYRGALKGFYWVSGVTILDVLLSILVFPELSKLLCHH
ncbi:hypothetical protein [Pseudomonas sp. Irchel 3A7]|uniref:hypothetical protein n=1 Tax=Pseudomonas sp. Irchel 3A7 TaxID=2008913 RepID=UPI000BA37D6A|nr:hypothetical protein [Pseudomonas sp. Irchel 3A7]